MAREYLTFIFGAGASVSYGFPTGDLLVRQLINRIEQNRSRTQELMVKNGAENSANSDYVGSLSYIANRLRRHDPSSIDSYLNEHYASDNNLLTLHKEFIAQELLHCLIEGERNKRFGSDNQENWLRFLVPELIKTFRSGVFKKCPIKIITFNYDLSLEFYINEIVRSSTTLAREQQDSLLRWVGESIVHVYGHIGAYNWQDELHNNQKSTWDYLTGYFDPENSLDVDEIWRKAQILAQGIQLIGERAAEPNVARARDWIENSKTLVISGYAFHEENNSLLKLKQLAYEAEGVIVGLWQANHRTLADVHALFEKGVNSPDWIDTSRSVQEIVPRSSARDPWLTIHNAKTYDLFKHKLELDNLYNRSVTYRR